MKKIKPYLYLMPSVILLVSIFILGIMMGILQSFGYFPTVGLTDLTWKYYLEVLKNKSFLASIKFSLYISFISSIVAVIFGVILAYAIYRWRGKKSLIESVYQIPIAVPHIISALLVYNILSQTGILPRILYGIGLIDDLGQFPNLLYDKTGIGIIISYVWKEIPFIALATYSILGNVSERLGNVARNLGANSKQVFFYIILPIIMPSVLSSFIIIFAFSFGAYEVPLLLGPTSPRVLAVQAYMEYINPNFSNRPYAMVYNTIITVISFVLTWTYIKLFEKVTKMKV